MPAAFHDRSVDLRQPAIFPPSSRCARASRTRGASTRPPAERVISVHARTFDVSRSGAGLTLTRQLPSGTAVVLCLRIPGTGHSALPASRHHPPPGIPCWTAICAAHRRTARCCSLNSVTPEPDERHPKGSRPVPSGFEEETRHACAMVVSGAAAAVALHVHLAGAAVVFGSDRSPHQLSPRAMTGEPAMPHCAANN